MNQYVVSETPTMSQIRSSRPVYCRNRGKPTVLEDIGLGQTSFRILFL